MEREHILRRTKFISSRVALYFFCILLAVLFIFPLVWMIVTSTKTEMQYASDLGSFATFIPNFQDLSTFFDNYASVFTQYDIWQYALNSFGYAAAVVVGNIVVNALAGYVMAKFNFPGKGFVTFLIMFLLIVPVETTIIPLYSIVHTLGMFRHGAGGHPAAFGQRVQYLPVPAVFRKHFKGVYRGGAA